MDQLFTVYLYVLTGLLGLCVGSFLNVVIYRLPKGMSLATPPSHCTRCNYRLRWFDNVPVLSYLFLGGKCRKCRAPISFRYTAVELFNAALWLLCVALLWEKSIPFAIACALALSVFLCIFFIDLSHGIIFDRFQIILLALGVVTTLFDPDFKWYSHLIGGAAGFFVFLLVSVLFAHLCGREGLGGGDVKLAGTAGLLLGWERLLLGLLIATVPLALFILLRRALGAFKKGKSPPADGASLAPTGEKPCTPEEDELPEGAFPFGPALVTGFTVAMLFGTPIITWYLALLGV